MTVDSIVRTFRVIECLGESNQALSIIELSRTLNIPPSSLHRILSCLKCLGYVTQNEARRYQLGYRLYSLVNHHEDERSLVPQARPFMEQLAQHLSKTVSLCVMNNHEIQCLAYVASSDTALFQIRTLGTSPLHATSAGKAILAALPPEEARILLKNISRKALTPQTLTKLSALLKQLEETRKRGWAFCNEELQMGIQGAAVAILNHRNHPVAALAFNALTAENSMTSHNITLLKQYAQRLSQQIGHTTTMMYREERAQ